jgi:hypothetical protein
MYFPRNWGFGSALSKLWNFWVGFEPHKPPLRYATAAAKKKYIMDIKEKLYRTNAVIRYSTIQHAGKPN